MTYRITYFPSDEYPWELQRNGQGISRARSEGMIAALYFTAVAADQKRAQVSPTPNR